jgi:hypothetical protein
MLEIIKAIPIINMNQFGKNDDINMELIFRNKHGDLNSFVD